MKIGVLLIHNSIGDNLTCNGIVNFLLKYYNKIIISTTLVSFKIKNTTEYIKSLHNNKVLVLDFNEINNVVKNCYVDIFNLMLKQNKKLQINFTYNNFYNENNLFIKKFNIEKIYIYSDNGNLLDNGTKHYKNVGLNKIVRLEYFNYKRNTVEEDIVYKNIMEKYKIVDNNYNIICEGLQCDNVKSLINKKYITNNFVNINIHNLVKNPLHLIKLIENAKEVHLIENSHCLMVYYLQYKKLMKLNKINYHIYSRVRPEKQKLFFNMVLNPKLNNWIVLK
jgi:hypothetical protein